MDVIDVGNRSAVDGVVRTVRAPDGVVPDHELNADVLRMRDEPVCDLVALGVVGGAVRRRDEHVERAAGTVHAHARCVGGITTARIAADRRHVAEVIEQILAELVTAGPQLSAACGLAGPLRRILVRDAHLRAGGEDIGLWDPTTLHAERGVRRRRAVVRRGTCGQEDHEDGQSDEGDPAPERRAIQVKT